MSKDNSHSRGFLVHVAAGKVTCWRFQRELLCIYICPSLSCIHPLTLGSLFTSLDSGPHMVLWMVWSPVIWYPLCLDMVAVVLYGKGQGDCWVFDA